MKFEILKRTDFDSPSERLTYFFLTNTQPDTLCKAITGKKKEKKKESILKLYIARPESLKD